MDRDTKNKFCDMGAVVQEIQEPPELLWIAVLAVLTRARLEIDEDGAEEALLSH